MGDKEQEGLCSGKFPYSGQVGVVIFPACSSGADASGASVWSVSRMVRGKKRGCLLYRIKTCALSTHVLGWTAYTGWGRGVLLCCPVFEANTVWIQSVILA